MKDGLEAVWTCFGSIDKQTEGEEDEWRGQGGGELAVENKLPYIDGWQGVVNEGANAT